MRFTWRSSWILLLLVLPAFAQQKINPGSQVNWPAGCIGAYVPASNICVPPGTAANPAGMTGNLQKNGGGTFAPAILGTDYVAPPQVLGFGYSKYYGNGINNGIKTCLATPLAFCQSDPSYATTEQYNFSQIPYVTSPTYLIDNRPGLWSTWYHNWATQTPSFPNALGEFPAQGVNFQYDGATPANHVPAGVVHNFVSIVPGYSIGNPSVGPQSNWFTDVGLGMFSKIRSAGIHETFSCWSDKYSVGDNVCGYVTVHGAGGATATSDERTKSFAASTQEYNNVYNGTVTAGFGSGSTQIKTTPLLFNDGLGVGRIVIDLTQGPSSTGHFTSITPGCVAGACSNIGVDFTVPVSTAWGNLNGNCAPVLNTSPPFSTSTACSITVLNGTFNNTDIVCFDSQFEEQTKPTAVTALSVGLQVLTMPVRRDHATGSRIYQGGMCGSYGEATSYTIPTGAGQTLKYLFNIIGSESSSQIQGVIYQAGTTATGLLGPSAQDYDIINLSSLSNSGTTVFATFVQAGSTLSSPTSYASYLIAGATNAAFNGTCTNVVWTSSATLTCTLAGLTGAQLSATATASLGTNGLKLWQGAEVLDVQNYSTCTAPLVNPCVDGTLTLEPNVMTTANNDVIEETEQIAAGWHGATILNQFNNRYSQFSGGLLIQVNGPGQTSNGQITGNSGTSLVNSDSVSSYAGGGGTTPPITANTIQGPFGNTFIMNNGPMQTGQSVFLLTPNNRQMADVNYTYNFLSSDNLSGRDQLTLTPNNGFLTISTPTRLTFGAQTLFTAGAFASMTVGDTLHFAALATPVNGAFSTFSRSDCTLPDATTEFYRVYAQNFSGASIASSETSITTGSTGGTNCATIIWNRIAAAARYTVCGRTSGGELQIFTTATNADTLSFTDDGNTTPSGACSATNTSLPAITFTDPASGFLTTLKSSPISASIAVALPASSGTLALTSQLPAVPVKITNSITPAAAPVSGCAEQTFTYTSLVSSQGVSVSPPAMGAHIWIGYSRVSAANTVAIDFCGDATSGTPPSGNYIAVAF